MTGATRPRRPRMGARGGFVLRLARRFARTAALRRSATSVFVAGMCLMTMWITLGVMSLSGEQVADRDLGRFDYRAGYGTVTLSPGDEVFAHDLLRRVRNAGVSDAVVMLSATDMQLPTTPARDVTLLETEWNGEPFPTRYELLSGRWPTQPGEIVVTEPSDVHTVAGEVLTLLGGQVRLQVVGTANDRHARTTNLLAAPGTWAQMPPRLTTGFPMLKAQPSLRWSGGNPDVVLATFTQAAQDWSAGQDTAEPVDQAAVAATLVTREDLRRRPDRSWIQRSPAGYAVPSVLLPLVAMLLVFGINDRRFRRALASMVSLGVPRRPAAAALTAATLFWCLVAALAGLAAGVGVGAVVRAVLERVRDTPSGPVTGLALPAAQLLALVLLAGVSAGVALARAPKQPRPPRERAGYRPRHADPRRQRWARDARHLAAAAAWCAVVIVGVGADTATKAMVLTGVVIAAVLLILPEVITAVLRLLPGTGPRMRLARRQLLADRRRATAALAVLTVLLGGSVAYVVLLDSLIRTNDLREHAEVLPGQIQIAQRGSRLPAAEPVIRAVEASGGVDGLTRMEVRSLWWDDVVNQSSTVVTRANSDPYLNPSLLVVDSTDQAAALLGRRLTAEQAATLDDGGLLVWADAPNPPPADGSRAELVLKRDDTVQRRLGDVPTRPVDVAQVGWRDGTDGIMLHASVERLGLPPLTAGPIMYTGATPDQAARTQQAVSRAGMDAKSVQIWSPPEPPLPPAALVATAVGLVILTLIAVLTATRGQARSLRGYLARLVVIGVPSRWARHVLLLQHAVLLATATALGAVIALVPTAVLAVQIDKVVLAVPWTQLASLLAAIYLATTAGALHSLLRLRAREGMGAAM